MLRQIAARLEAVKTAQRCGRHMDDIIDDEAKGVQVVVALAPVMDQGEERFLKTLTSLKSTPQFNPPKYSGKLDIDELLDWIIKMEKYFE